MEVKFFRPSLPEWSIVSEDIRKTYEEGVLYPGKHALRLEEIMRQHFNVKYAVAVSNCSDALILSLCDLPAGTKVIIPSYTFRATVQAAEWNGLIPVVTDVDEWGYIDPDVLESCLKNNQDARAVMPVILWGNVTYIEEISDICHKYGVKIIYDAAHGMSSMYDGITIGQLGDACVFSIAVTKPLPCGEGAIFTTNSDHLAKLVAKGRLHGNVFGNLDCIQRGMNAKIGEINSIIAIHGLSMINESREGREKIAQFYINNLSDLPIRFQRIDPRCITSRKDFGFWVEDEHTRNKLKIFLEQSGIGIKTYFYPAIHNFANFNGIVYKADVAGKLSYTCINLPCYSHITDAEARYVVDKVKEFYK